MPGKHGSGPGGSQNRLCQIEKEQGQLARLIQNRVARRPRSHICNSNAVAEALGSAQCLVAGMRTYMGASACVYAPSCVRIHLGPAKGAVWFAASARTRTQRNRSRDRGKAQKTGGRRSARIRPSQNMDTYQGGGAEHTTAQGAARGA
eukprot:3081379-Alexandrium_andersonii.AAC.1